MERGKKENGLLSAKDSVMSMWIGWDGAEGRGDREGRRETQKRGSERRDGRRDTGGTQEGQRRDREGAEGERGVTEEGQKGTE